jgi:hypothetical protein
VTTRDAVIAAAGECFAEGLVEALTEGSVAEAAARSYGVMSGRVTQQDMELRIARMRADARKGLSGRRGAAQPRRKSA